MHLDPLKITDWHTQSARQVADCLDVDIEHGPNVTAVGARIKIYGPNEIQESVSRSLWGMFLSLFAHGIWQHVVWVGLLIGLLSIATQAWAFHSGMEHW